jgi:hypothetical protein
MPVLINQIEIITTSDSSTPREEPLGDTSTPAAGPRRTELSSIDFQTLLDHRKQRGDRRSAH